MLNDPIRNRVLGVVSVIAALAAISTVRAGTCTSTAAQTEGPYYHTPTPETTNLVIGSDGPLLTLNGQVVNGNCDPIAYTWLDVWHANPLGQYDNTPPYDQYRGHFFTDANGQFTLHTILPGLYPGRTRHMHVKADAANTAVLTTQLYFPGEPLNGSDPLYNPTLQITMTQQPDGSYVGSYVFVLPQSGACTAPNVGIDPSGLTVATGATATFSITATGSTPMTFRWRKDGVPLSNGNGISGATTTTLTIAPVSCAAAGSYDCQALSSCGIDASATAQLTVTGCCNADLNSDGAVNGNDTQSFVNCLLGGSGSNCTCADFSGNGSAGEEDVPLFVAHLLE